MRYLVCFFLLFTSCARVPLHHVEDAMRPAKSTPKFSDSLSKESFFSALKKHIDVMKTSEKVTDPMVFGKRKIEKAKYIAALSNILEHESDWGEWISSHFDFYEVYGQDTWGEVMSTGYYEPQVHGAHQKSKEFSQALYATPNDLVSINLKYFANKFSFSESQTILYGRIENKKVLPYFTRKEIDTDNQLKDKNLELAWLDPVDAFFIQIQGSGVILFDNGEKISVGYDNQNGHNYEALGKFLKDIIPLEKMSMQKIKEYLHTLHREDQQKIMNLNPRYVFFKKIEGNALTHAGMEVSDGRTIATDSKFFPKGALAFLDIDEPQFETLFDIEPKSWLKMPRFVLDEDTGGAIIGGGRVDLYFGAGDTAAQKAGVMKQKGRLYYLVPRI